MTLKFRTPRSPSQKKAVLPASVIALLFGLTGLILLVFVWYSTASEILRVRRVTLDFSDRYMASLAGALAEQTTRSLQGVTFILDRTVSRLANQHPENRGDGLNALLRSESEGVPQLRQVDVVDSAGIRVGTSSLNPTAVDISSRNYFQKLKSSIAGTTIVTEPELSLADGRRTFVVAKRMSGANGAFTGVAIALVEDAYFERFYRDINPGDGTRIQLLRPDNVPVVDFQSGQARNGNEAARAVERPVVDFPLKVRVSRSEANILASWYIAVRELVARATVMTLFVLIVSVALLLQLRRIRAAEVERLALERQLRQSQKLEALGTFAGAIAHDFNNILAAILGYSERAADLLDPDTPQHRYIDQVVRAGQRASQLIERILTFSRSGSSNVSSVMIQPAVLEAIELIKGRLPSSVRFETGLSDTNACVRGDSTSIHQILMNLCTNAIHAMPSGGVLTVGLELKHVESKQIVSNGALEAGDYVCLSVADTGVGIPAEHLETIFNPFFTTRRAGEGTGLGLSMVDAIVREVGGAIELSTTPGRGTRFGVYLPVTDKHSGAQDFTATTAPRGEGQVVMIVDDERPLVDLAEETLADLGYEPVGFDSAEEALRVFSIDPDRFDIVLTDYAMGALSGLDLVTQVHQARADIPVVVCTGNPVPALFTALEHGHIRALLRKPLRRAELASALAQALSPVTSPRRA